MKAYSVLFLTFFSILFIAAKVWNRLPEAQLLNQQKQDLAFLANTAPAEASPKAKLEKPVDVSVSDEPATKQKRKLSAASAPVPTNTLAPVAVATPKVVRDVQGKPRKIVTPPIKFNWNTADISNESFGTLTELADLIKDLDEIQNVRVEGHTDASGDPAYNVYLSQERAKSVANFLKEHGVDSSKLAHAGIGDQQPIAPNETKEGRARNRRVEFEVTPNGANEPSTD